ncbi:MAG: YaiI/YqxD family protein [Ardenticatenales bacterium]
MPPDFPAPPLPPPPTILVDADGCPVKDEVYRVARRYKLKVVLVANAWIGGPPDDMIERVVVGRGLDVADDWIAERAGPRDIVVTADIPLAARCVPAGARVLSPRGRVFTPDDVGDALATRDLLAGLREGGMVTGGPPPFTAKDRSRFLGRLDDLVQAVLRAG